MNNLRSHLKGLISMMPFAFRISAILLLLNLNVCSQIAQPEQTLPSKLTSEQLLHSAKIYFRDTTELPLVQTTTVSVSDSSGRIRKAKPYSRAATFQPYRVETEKQDPLGQTEALSLSDSSSRANKTSPDPRAPIFQKERVQEKNGNQLQPDSRSEWKLSAHLNSPFWAKPWVTKMAKISVNSDIWTSIPAMIFTVLAYAPEKYVLNASPAADQSGLVMAKLTPAKLVHYFL